jgi:hypothetical protein
MSGCFILASLPLLQPPRRLARKRRAVAEQPQVVVPFRFGHLVGEDQVRSIHRPVDARIPPAERRQGPALARQILEQRRRHGRDHQHQRQVRRLRQLVEVGRLVQPAVRHEPHQIAGPERRVDGALVLDDRHPPEPRPERAQHERLVVLPIGAEATQEQEVRALRLDREPHLGQDLEVRRSPARDQAHEGQVPEVESQLHGGEATRDGKRTSTGGGRRKEPVGDLVGGSARREIR